MFDGLYRGSQKQTNTTQRWKLQIISKHFSLPIHTKIEFSRRGINDGVELNTVDNKLIQLYKIHPIFIPHYNSNTALHQKIQALIGRNETQARDLFDIHLLLQRSTETKKIIQQFTSSERKTAHDNAMNCSFDQFYSQVVTYLEPSYMKQYKDPAIWEHIVLSITEYLSCD